MCTLHSAKLGEVSGLAEMIAVVDPPAKRLRKSVLHSSARPCFSWSRKQMGLQLLDKHYIGVKLVVGYQLETWSVPVFLLFQERRRFGGQRYSMVRRRRQQPREPCVVFKAPFVSLSNFETEKRGVSRATATVGGKPLRDLWTYPSTTRKQGKIPSRQSIIDSTVLYRMRLIHPRDLFYHRIHCATRDAALTRGHKFYFRAPAGYSRQTY